MTLLAERLLYNKKGGGMEKRIYQLLLEIKEVLTDSFQSGFFSVHDSIIKRMKKLASLSGQYGLEFAEKNLTFLAQALEKQRHKVVKDSEQMVLIFCSLDQYISFCIQKIEYDAAKSQLKEQKETHKIAEMDS